MGKLTLVTNAADVNSRTIGHQCKLGALAGKRINRRFQDSDARAKHDLSSIKAEVVRIGFAIASLQRNLLDIEAAVQVNTLSIERERGHSRVWMLRK